MKTANELDLMVTALVQRYDPIPVIEQHMRLVGAGQLAEVRDQSDRGCNRYYQWLACLVKLLRPKQVVELGAAAGISTMMMLSELPKDSLLISVDIDPNLAWKWMDKEYPQLVKILGDDLDPSIWTKDLYPPVRGVDLAQTDIWFIDSLHTAEQLQKELDLYQQFWKKGTVVVLDDINVPGIREIWDSLPYDKCETTIPNHYTGFGHFIV
jgi:cephalosporin hydroxylase